MTISLSGASFSLVFKHIWLPKMGVPPKRSNLYIISNRSSIYSSIYIIIYIYVWIGIFQYEPALPGYPPTRCIPAAGSGVGPEEGDLRCETPWHVCGDTVYR